MTRADVRTFAWILALALVIEFSWIHWGSYLAFEFAEHWVGVAPTEEIQRADTVQVENPYGAVIAMEAWLKVVAPIIFVLLVSILSAGNFQHRAGRGAAAVIFIALLIGRIFVWVPFWRHNFPYVAEMTAREWVMIMAAMLIVALVGAALAWLATSLMVRWRARG